MKPLITTVRALRELATGIAPEAVSSSAVLFQHDTPEVECLVAASDDQNTPRIIIWRKGNTNEPYVPQHLTAHREEVLGRMASFADRARADGPLTLPRHWHQYKHKNLIAFFAVPEGDNASSRWIAEVRQGGQGDVIFWLTTTGDHKETLEEFYNSRPSLPPWSERWLEATVAAKRQFSRARRPPTADTEISLSALEQAPAKGWTYEQWLAEISDDQKAFIESPTDRSIRLRGPAGSGKTLALTLKAVREVLLARNQGDAIKVLVATHSWALASQIDEAIASLNLGQLPEIDVFPLLEIAKGISPQYVQDQSGFSLVGDDSYSGKRAQLNEIEELLEDFIGSDWITYKGEVTESLRARIDSKSRDDRLALAWDLLIEFGSVIGASAIFPGAGSERRYMQVPRASWMLPLTSTSDLRVVFRLYEKYMRSLEARSLITSDQVLADFQSHLETHAWNRARKVDGYDLVFVDEFHLFSPLERQALHYLTRDVTSYPRIFMAVDPRQSPSEAFIGVAADETESFASAPLEDDLGDVTSYELTTVHRFTPQILNLVKHIHHEFPTLDLGHDWDVDFGAVESAKEPGPVPTLVTSASRNGEETDISKAVQELYNAGRIALAVVDTRQWARFSELASRIGASRRYHVSTISGRSDIEGVGYRSRGLVVGPAEYLAGLQFDTVLVAGIPDLRTSAPTTNERTRLLSLLYLAISRAQREVIAYVNEDDGDPEVLRRAVQNGLMSSKKGSLV